MNCSRIQTGDTEPIEALVVDAFGVPLTGKTDIKVKIRRLSNNQWFDWNDDSFKITPIQLAQQLQEIDSLKAPGEYKLNIVSRHENGFDTSTISNPIVDDIYEITVFQDSGTDASGLPYVGEVKVGHFVDEIPDFTDNEKDELRTVLGITGTGIPDDTPSQGVLTVILGLVQHNFFLDQTIYNGAGLLISGRIRIFPDKTSTDSATDGGTGEGELASFSITTVAEPVPSENLPATYKVTRES